MIVFGGVQGVYAQSSGSNGTDTASNAIVAQAAPAAVPLTAVGQTIALTPDEAKQSATGNVAELQQMIHGNDLTELRTTYNGSYGTSLMFRAKDMTYYVALFQQKNFWRVIKTQDEARAEQIYRDFARQTVQLSDVEIRRAKLEAQKAYTDRLVALSQERASRLQADLNIAHEQQTIVNSLQQQTRAEAAALAQQKAQSQEQLRATQRQVRDLQRQLESGLPVH
ncbi:putative signal peptide protein [Paraburkholderia phymatum STM815]|uniref:Putative signal peptide protein n=2 Tax=Paraburkholderia phymatum TaxID=148447 RepID=B2JKS0_PARP8|nr:putative signal peptide protein [Paraburkholderia phymatum STM815]